MNKQDEYIQAIHEAYPEFVIKSVRLNQHGQFNDILIVNEEVIFRFPKTEREAAKQAIETALLQELQARVTLAIPNPVYQSKETATIGQVFMGYRLLPGEPLWPVTLRAVRDEAQIQHLAEQLATFLRQLHTTPADALAVQLPAFQGCAEWQELYERFRAELFPFMRPDARAWTTSHFETFLQDPRNCTYEPALIHGDFGPSNILYDAQTKSISGIIDFSSTQWGDPALDFAALIGPVSYSKRFLERFSAVYPGIEAALSRSYFYAGTFALQEALFGLEDGDQQAFESGIADYR